MEHPKLPDTFLEKDSDSAQNRNAWALSLVGLDGLVALTRGRHSVRIGLIDGLVNVHLPAFNSDNIEIVETGPNAASEATDLITAHGTFVAGILAGSRESGAPSLCPECRLFVLPIFQTNSHDLPSATTDQLAAAIYKCVDAEVDIINLSLAVRRPSTNEESVLRAALDFCAARDVLVVAAAGNQSTIGGSSTITRHPWVIPVIACDRFGRPAGGSNLSRSAAINGFAAPGAEIQSLDGNSLLLKTGTSFAAPFVTGAAALLRSLFPDIPRFQIKRALEVSSGRVRRSLMPPILNASGAYQDLLSSLGKQKPHAT